MLRTHCPGKPPVRHRQQAQGQNRCCNGNSAAVSSRAAGSQRPDLCINVKGTLRPKMPGTYAQRVTMKRANSSHHSISSPVEFILPDAKQIPLRVKVTLGSSFSLNPALPREVSALDVHLHNYDNSVKLFLIWESEASCLGEMTFRGRELIF